MYICMYSPDLVSVRPANELGDSRPQQQARRRIGDRLPDPDRVDGLGQHELVRSSLPLLHERNLLFARIARRDFNRVIVLKPRLRLIKVSSG